MPDATSLPDFHRGPCFPRSDLLSFCLAAKRDRVSRLVTTSKRKWKFNAKIEEKPKREHLELERELALPVPRRLLIKPVVASANAIVGQLKSNLQKSPCTWCQTSASKRTSERQECSSTGQSHAKQLTTSRSPCVFKTFKRPWAAFTDLRHDTDCPTRQCLPTQQISAASFCTY